MDGTCQLCLKHKKLIKAHIVPQFLYKPIFNGTGIKTVMQRGDKLYESKIATGIYDDSILCADCDQRILGALDEYGSRIWNGYKNLDLGVKDFVDENDPRVRWRQASNADAERFRKFLLSILWRASVSKTEFFDNVNLGQKHTSAIRELLLNDVIADDYDIIVAHYSIGDEKAREFMTTINHYRNPESKHYYSQMLSGLQVTWFVSSNGLTKGLETFTVNATNGLKVIHSPLQGFAAIVHFVGEKALAMPKLRNFQKPRNN